MANIAVVEDTPVVRRAVCLALRQAGHTVEAFERFEAAYESLSKRAPDLLVADVNLPDGNGLELVARLREVHPEFFPVIITSGLDGADDFKRGFVAGADDYIRKPFPASELVAKCERHLGKAADASTECIEAALPGGSANAFSRYEVTGIAGRGNNGVVYNAIDRHTAREVALKVLTALGSQEEARLRFLRETYALASVESPHIVSVTDYGVTEGRFYYAMDLVVGPSVKTKVNEDGPMPIAEVPGFLRGLAKALEVLHANKILHRDVAPTNVVLEGGDWSRPVLIDFGLAKREFDHALTQDDLLMGTPGYIDPLLLVGDPPSQQGDLFGLGMVARFAILALDAFPDRRGMSLINHMLRNPVSVPADLPSPIRDLLLSLTSVDPELRLGSATELLGMLEG